MCLCAGKGVSSSAAIEVAVMSALLAAYDMQVEGRELALLCQKAENLVVGAPCGIMDQVRGWGWGRGSFCRISWFILGLRVLWCASLA
jgi:galactokinase